MRDATTNPRQPRARETDSTRSGTDRERRRRTADGLLAFEVDPTFVTIRRPRWMTPAEWGRCKVLLDAEFNRLVEEYLTAARQERLS